MITWMKYILRSLILDSVLIKVYCFRLNEAIHCDKSYGDSQNSEKLPTDRKQEAAFLKRIAIIVAVDEGNTVVETGR